MIYLNDEISSFRWPEFAPLLDWSNETVQKIHADNQGNHELAVAVAGWLWLRFDKYRESVEQLSCKVQS